MLYLLLAGALFPALGWAAWALAVAAGLSRIVQSIYAESQRRTYLWWAYGVPWLRTGSGIGARAGGLDAAYLKVSRWLSAGTEAVEPFVASGDPRGAPLARAEGRRTLPLQVVLGANLRTVLLGLSMLAGSAAWFFLSRRARSICCWSISIVQQRRAHRPGSPRRSGEPRPANRVRCG